MWHLYNGNLAPGETLRVFPLSNWTELDVWTYIQAEGIDVVPLYFAAMRPTVERDGQIIVVDDERMRFRAGRGAGRSDGPVPLPGLLPAVVRPCRPMPRRSRTSLREMRTTRMSERAGRLIDQDQDASMEKKKREGYF